MTKLTLLALDTSTEACSVALLYNGEKTHLNELAQRTHTKRILPMIDKILANSGLHLNQVNALAFGRGPGSFTGVRVGAGIAQGLAFGADLPVIPISNLTVMAQAFRVGTGWAAYSQFTEKNLTSSYIALPNALYMLELARVEYLQKRTISALEIEPIYLRNEVTWKKLPGRE